jgi:hypothetical protein
VTPLRIAAVLLLLVMAGMFVLAKGQRLGLWSVLPYSARDYGPNPIEGP